MLKGSVEDQPRLVTTVRGLEYLLACFTCEPQGRHILERKGKWHILALRIASRQPAPHRHNSLHARLSSLSQVWPADHRGKKGSLRETAGAAPAPSRNE